MGNQRVKTTLNRHGSDFFSRIGKKGFQVTTDRYFGGDRKAHLTWLMRRGWYMTDRELSYSKPGVFADPGPHPSRLEALKAWLEHAENNISLYNGPNSDKTE